MASLASIDLTDFDLSKALQTTRDTGDIVANKAANLALDATYVTIGFGLLTVQRVQVRRRELERALRR